VANIVLLSWYDILALFISFGKNCTETNGS